MFSFRSQLGALLLSVLAASSLRAAITYSVVDLGTLGGNTSAGNALNQSGQVTGAAYLLDDSSQMAFISGADGAGPLQNLSALGGSESFGQAIHANGRVAGSAKIADEVSFRAFLSDPSGGALMNLGTLGGGSSYAFGANGSGQVAGYSLTSGGSTTHAYLSGAGGGALHDLGTLPGGAMSFGQSVNASGQVAGYSGTPTGNHAFISEVNGGALRDLGTLGGRFSFGVAINDAGQVTGRSETSGVGQHAFRSGPNGGPLLDLGTLGGFSSFGQAINSNGDVVGYSFLSDNSTQHAFVYTTASGMVDLNSRISANSGWVLVEARGINDRGQITGQGTFGGKTHGFLLTLVPTEFRITSVARLANGHVLVKGVGTPTQTYAVQAANDVRSTFIQVATIIAGNDGTLEFEDIDAAILAHRFYRFSVP